MRVARGWLVAAAGLVLVSACSDPDSGESDAPVVSLGQAMRMDPLARVGLPNGDEIAGLETGPNGGQGPLTTGEATLERRWRVEGFTQQRMADVMDHVASFDVYFTSLTCEAEYIVAGGFKRIGPYPGSVRVELRVDDPEGAGPEDAVVSIALQLHSSAEPGGVLPAASYLWRQSTNDPDGAGCDERLIDIVEASQDRQPPPGSSVGETTEPRDDRGG